MHKHIDWDAPGAEGVSSHYAKDPNDYGEPRPGTIVTGHYRGLNVRVKVEAYKEGVSIGEVAALIDTKGQRHQQHDQLSVGDIVRLPDDKRAFESSTDADDEND